MLNLIDVDDDATIYLPETFIRAKTVKYVLAQLKLCVNLNAINDSDKLMLMLIERMKVLENGHPDDENS